MRAHEALLCYMACKYNNFGKRWVFPKLVVHKLMSTDQLITWLEAGHKLMAMP